MKTTGIRRMVDSLGRIVLPIELRNSLGIEPKDLIEIYVEGDKIILKKAQISCVICGSSKNALAIDGKMICEDCLGKIKKLS
ncbi:MAG: AbrB/MazE/SpoVT family DNA-binding domain-containing protein [Clostridia bacterium]|nr:AbrB/MazE/SpoVT family DNA-binding domain-containing protein [Clostridia bacterium]